MKISEKQIIECILHLKDYIVLMLKQKDDSEFNLTKHYYLAKSKEINELIEQIKNQQSEDMKEVI